MFWAGAIAGAVAVAALWLALHVAHRWTDPAPPRQWRDGGAPGATAADLHAALEPRRTAKP